ncbi:MAG: hypothetical protein ACHQWU_11360 [Gemmatimonadales bacterium]
MRRGSQRGAVLAGLAAGMLGTLSVVSCGPSGPPSLHQFTLSYDFTITPDEAPPRARDDIHYMVRVFDRKTREPIENGEGQLFAGKPIEEDAPSGPQTKTWDGLAYGPEIGMYRAKVNYVVPGLWAVAIRFRRDSLHPLERTDWMQDVIPERPSAIP